MFAKYSWFFRNTLVRANYEDLSKGIYKTEKHLIQFISNLLLKESYILKNRSIHIHFNETQNDTVNNALLTLIKQNNTDGVSSVAKLTANELSKRLNISLSTAKRKIKKLKDQQIIERIGSDKTGYWKIIEPKP